MSDARTVDDVLAEYNMDECVNGPDCPHMECIEARRMATRIVALETRLATLDAERAGVVELKEWRVVTRDGKSVNAISYTVERSAQIDCHGYDSDFPADAPHRVMRVCLTPTTPEASDGE